MNLFVRKTNVSHNFLIALLRLPLATFHLLSLSVKKKRFATKELHDSVLFFCSVVVWLAIQFPHHPFIKRTTALHTSKKRAKKLLSYIIIFAFRDIKILLKREGKKELNFCSEYALVVENTQGDDDNLLIFHFTPMHASQRCAWRKFSFAWKICWQSLWVKVTSSHKDDFLSQEKMEIESRQRRRYIKIQALLKGLLPTKHKTKFSAILEEEKGMKSFLMRRRLYT